MNHMKAWWTGCVILIMVTLSVVAGATSEVESDEEMLGYMRLLFSEKNVVEAYSKLVSEDRRELQPLGDFSPDLSPHKDQEQPQQDLGAVVHLKTRILFGS